MINSWQQGVVHLLISEQICLHHSFQGIFHILNMHHYTAHPLDQNMLDINKENEIRLQLTVLYTNYNTFPHVEYFDNDLFQYLQAAKKERKLFLQAIF